MSNAPLRSLFAKVLGIFLSLSVTLILSRGALADAEARLPSMDEIRAIHAERIGETSGIRVEWITDVTIPRGSRSDERDRMLGTVIDPAVAADAPRVMPPEDLKLVHTGEILGNASGWELAREMQNWDMVRGVATGPGSVLLYRQASGFQYEVTQASPRRSLDEALAITITPLDAVSPDRFTTYSEGSIALWFCSTMPLQGSLQVLRREAVEGRELIVVGYHPRSREIQEFGREYFLDPERHFLPCEMRSRTRRATVEMIADARLGFRPVSVRTEFREADGSLELLWETTFVDFRIDYPIPAGRFTFSPGPSTQLLGPAVEALTGAQQ